MDEARLTKEEEKEVERLIACGQLPHPGFIHFWGEVCLRKSFMDQVEAGMRKHELEWLLPKEAREASKAERETELKAYIKRTEARKQ